VTGSLPSTPSRIVCWTASAAGEASLSRRWPGKGTDHVTIRVVIAEDEAIIRLDLRETLEEEGYEVVAECGRGDQAIELVREHRPDLAILDIKMPGVDGLEAARVITAERICGVLMLTAFSQREVIEDARDAGALAYLVKPYQKSDLIPAIEVAIGRFRELQQLSGEVDSLGEQLEARKLIDRAKGYLIDRHGLSEQNAFSFIQRTAMSQRLRMREVAQQVLDGALAP
jgi:response regulator NasT